MLKSYLYFFKKTREMMNLYSMVICALIVNKLTMTIN